jgi:hypothetical protein
MIFGKNKERLFNQIVSASPFTLTEKQTITRTIPLPKSEVNKVLQELFTVMIEPDEVIEPNQIVAWRKREGLENPIDCVIMYDYEGDKQRAVYLRVQDGGHFGKRNEKESTFQGSEFDGGDKITPRMMNRKWITGIPYKMSIPKSRTLNFSRSGFQ